MARSNVSLPGEKRIMSQNEEEEKGEELVSLYEENGIRFR